MVYKPACIYEVQLIVTAEVSPTLKDSTCRQESEMPGDPKENSTEMQRRQVERLRFDNP